MNRGIVVIAMICCIAIGMAIGTMIERSLWANRVTVAALDRPLRFIECRPKDDTVICIWGTTP